MNRAFIFDLNGTMINDMEFHLDAWHTMLNRLGAALDRATVRGHMYGKNEELLQRIFGPDRFTPEDMAAIIDEKERGYQEVFRPHLQLINGLPAFLDQASQLGIPMAIGSAANLFNIGYVLDNLNIRHYFKAVISAESVQQSKPHPEVFLMAANALNVPPTDCIVFEDAPKGVEAALNAGMRSVVLTTMHTRDEFADYPNVIGFVEDYTDPLLERCFAQP